MGQTILAPLDDMGHRTHRPRKKTGTNSNMYIVANGNSDNSSSSHGDSYNIGIRSNAISGSGAHGNSNNVSNVNISSSNCYSSSSNTSSITEAHVPLPSVDVSAATYISAATINPATTTSVHSANARKRARTDPLTTALAAYAPALVALTTKGEWPKGRQTTSVPVKIFGSGNSSISTLALVDTGSDICAMSLTMAKSAALTGVTIQPLGTGDYKTMAGVEQGDGVRLVGTMELLLTISDVVLAVRVYVAEALPVALILGGDFQRAHNASLTWRSGLCYYKPCPKATAITTSSSGQQSGSEFTCDGLAIQASDVAPAAKPPSKPIVTEDEAQRVRESITAQGYTVVLEEAEHGAHGTLMTMDDIIVKRGTKTTVYLQSSVVPNINKISSNNYTY
jgi:hypothetical protein